MIIYCLGKEARDIANDRLSNQTNTISLVERDITIQDMIKTQEDIIGVIDYDEKIWGHSWDWRIEEIFKRDKKCGFVGLSRLDNNNGHISIEGYWYSPKNHKPPIGVNPQLFPLTPTKICGPGPFFVNTNLLRSISSRVHKHINTYSASEISLAISGLGYNVYSIVIPFEKTNMYISYIDSK